MDDREPDDLETKVRAVSGGLLGLFVAACVIIELRPPSLIASSVLGAVCIVARSVGTVQLGDGFWLSLRWWK